MKYLIAMAGVGMWSVVKVFRCSRFSGFRICALIAGCLMMIPCAAEKAGDEILYPGKDFAKLDTFEGLRLEDADKLYIKRDFTGAYAAYKSFSLEFDKSPALSYALLRMGRCLHQLDKRHAAVKAYQDVVDYFPDDVRYAAAALYYIGQCHAQNGDTAKQTAVWARMVKDDEYVTMPNSGTALAFLANAMDKLEKYGEATEYRWRTAVNFAKSNEGAAREARDAVIHHYTRRRPNHEKLKEFFTATNAFGDRHGKGENPQEDKRYWDTVFGYALGARTDRENICRYWAARFGNLFPDDDGRRIKLFEMQLAYEKDGDAWAARMEKQFAKKPVTLDRVIAWVPSFSRDLELQKEFAAKHGGPLMAGAEPGKQTALLERMDRRLRNDFYANFIARTVSGLDRKGKTWMMNRLRHPLGMHEEAQSVMRSVPIQGMSDEELRNMGMFAAHYLPEEDVLRYFAKIKDKTYATKTRFDYYMSRRHRNRPFQEKALAEIPALKKSPKYAQGLDWTAAELLHGLGRHEEAIKAYRAANRQPDSTWRITDCFVALKQYAQAVKTVADLESVKSTASAACFKIADIYRIAGDKGKEVQQLRLVLKRYPKSSQSSEAHNRLESYGVALVGGEAEAEE